MEQKTCIVCESPVTNVLDLNLQPLANNLIDSADEAFEKYPLGLAKCERCTHGQLSYFVDPKKLFVNYLYASGTSQTLTEFFRWFAKSLNKAETSTILEIASNDGSLLSCLASEGFAVTGIDPAANLNAKAVAAGHRVITGFFPDAATNEKFDLIVAMNVAAHNPDPQKFMRGVANSLNRNGVAIIQTSQAMMLGNGEFDTIYHEHYSFYTVRSMSELANRAGLKLESVRLASVHGTSFLFFLRHADSDSESYRFSGGKPFEVEWPKQEPTFLSEGFVDADATYESFVTKAESLMANVRGLVEKAQQRGTKVALVGIAAKALTFIKASGIEPDYYFDEASLKLGKFVAGAKSPIQPFSEISNLKEDTLFIIGAWNFADEIIRKISFVRDRGARFVVYFPVLRIIEA